MEIKNIKNWGLKMTTLLENIQVVKEDLYVSWEKYNETAVRVAKKIHESKWDFDQIVAIARGGMFIGDSLSRIFKKPLALISASSYKGESKQQSTLIISKEIAMATNSLGKRILLVDDLVDSGGTISEVKDFIKQKYSNVEEIRTAVLWNKTGSTFKPDYYSESVDKKTWIHQPFETFDSIGVDDLDKC